MTQEEKQLLLQDLCCRLPYGVICHANEINIDGKLIFVNNLYDIAALYYDNAIGKFKSCPINDIKPYLRPMSSITEEERIKFSKLLVKRYCEEDWEGHISTSYCIEIDNVYTDDENGIKYPSVFSMDAIDWLNAHHLDYRGLVPMGLALEAKEGIYNIE